MPTKQKTTRVDAKRASRPTRKKTATKKTATKKTATKKTATKKTATKKTATKKTAKKTATKKTATKKTAKKTATKKVMSSTPVAGPPDDADRNLVAFAEALIARGLQYPYAWRDHPWGETVLKVKKKVFVFSGWYQGGFNFSFKLPTSGMVVLDLPFATPTGYGLGKSGWVSFRFESGKGLPPPGMIEEWMEESFRAVAPKTQIKMLDAR